ncbi:MAG: hypothetical protein ACRDIB_04835, partial [Ardenticatenaceae bacterium]
VELTDDGTLALVQVEVPRSEGELYEGLERITEQRAYRLVEGMWRRTLLPLNGAELNEQRSNHFVLRAPSNALTALNMDGALLEELEGLRNHILATWPSGQVVDTPLIIEVRPREFDTVGQQIRSHQFNTNVTQPIVVNAPATFDADPQVPLAADTQYKLALVEAVLFRLTGNFQEGFGTSAERSLERSLLARQVRLSEAQQAALSPAQQRVLRNWQRTQLNDHWLSPFSTPYPIPSATSDEDVGAQQERYRLSLALLVEQVRLMHGNEAIAQLARYGTSGKASLTLADAFLSVTGGTLEELEASAREFALTIE